MNDSREQHLDVLQNIEFGIIQVYRADPSLIDADAKDAADALVRHYQAEQDQRKPPVRRLCERAERVFQSVQSVCEFRLGRGSPADQPAAPESLTPLSDLVQCLRQIQKSIPRWSRQGGRRGYLDFVGQYLP